MYGFDLFPPLIFPITFRTDLPTVSFITANILNHLSCVTHQFGAWSPLNRSHLNVPVLIVGAGGNTLRDWDSQRHSAERPLSICTKFSLTFGGMSVQLGQWFWLWPYSYGTAHFKLYNKVILHHIYSTRPIDYAIVLGILRRNWTLMKAENGCGEALWQSYCSFPQHPFSRRVSDLTRGEDVCGTKH